MNSVSRPIIEAENLSKTYTLRKKAGRLKRERTTVEAVRDLNLAVAEGELLGYIGPNGAGKSTSIKMFTGILSPSAGTLRVAGLEPIRDRKQLARRIGVVFGQRTTLWWDLPLRDSFALLHRMYAVPEARFAANLKRYVALLELEPLLDTPVRQLSLGQRMRGDLTAALLHDPAVLYLDEPTIGLDVTSKAVVREFLAELNREQGTTIVLTTHDLDDIERLCRRVVVIDHGTVAYDGDLDALRARFAADRTLVVDLAEPGPAIDVPGATVARVDGPRQWLTFPAEANAAALVSAIAARYELLDVSIRDADIEEVIRNLYTG
ncbi:ABC transporter related [Catenulispora acidiphila DSM 44928]|uniref:ABC transporter related n=1 Tax=Catenulispora acidiphila (strain DSM 44928 / JCM 14897 / NBRC 102108 / NRRL B-24433 / ID139908) TaxID=479433 RepID=C7PVR1_CATAD|nr:ATP-binding cassette domain-containing protein [Catenulispora acidiphila]ACU71303.1 ABC transporter related [Catenulispora acidiphila DSM 44928]